MGGADGDGADLSLLDFRALIEIEQYSIGRSAGCQTVNVVQTRVVVYSVLRTLYSVLHRWFKKEVEPLPGVHLRPVPPRREPFPIST